MDHRVDELLERFNEVGFRHNPYFTIVTTVQGFMYIPYISSSTGI